MMPKKNIDTDKLVTGALVAGSALMAFEGMQALLSLPGANGKGTVRDRIEEFAKGPYRSPTSTVAHGLGYGEEYDKPGDAYRDSGFYQFATGPYRSPVSTLRHILGV